LVLQTNSSYDAQYTQYQKVNVSFRVITLCCCTCIV